MRGAASPPTAREGLRALRTADRLHFQSTRMMRTPRPSSDGDTRRRMRGERGDTNREADATQQQSEKLIWEGYKRKHKGSIPPQVILTLFSDKRCFLIPGHKFPPLPAGQVEV